MRNSMGKWYSALMCMMGLLAAPAAWAQEPASSPAGSSPGADATKSDASAPGAGSPAAGSPGTEAKPAAEPPKETPIPAWFRMDADLYGITVWAGAVHQAGPLSISSDILLTTPGYGEFDIGPTFLLGPVSITPMAGIQIDFPNHKAAALIAPELFTIIDLQRVYFESWTYGIFNSVFTKDTQNWWYTRDFLLIYPIKDLGIGPHFELTADLNKVSTTLPDGTKGPDDDAGISSMQIGGIVGVNYGAGGNKLLLYLGYETKKESQVDGNKLAGRFTFIHNW